MSGHGHNGGHGGGHGEHGNPLEQILEGIAPENVAKKVVIPHRKIREKFKLGEDQHQIEDYAAFNGVVQKYVQHHWKNWYKGDMGEEEALGQAHGILEEVFQKKGGVKHALGLAKEGKMDEVIGALSEHFEGQAQQHYVSHQIKSRIDPSDLDAQTELVKGIFEKYKPLLPAGTKFKKPEHYAASHGQLIQLYRGLMDQFMENYTEKSSGHGHGGGHGGGHGHH